MFTSHCVNLVVLCVVLAGCPSDMFLPSGLVGQDTPACGAPRVWLITGQVTRSQHPVEVELTRPSQPVRPYPFVRPMKIRVPCLPERFPVHRRGVVQR